MQKEIWKDIKGYKGLYQISNHGRVKSLLRKVKHGNRFKFIKEKIRKQYCNKKGYMLVVLSKHSIIKTFYIHHLIIMSFSNNKTNGNKLVIDHIDHNKLNNNLDNLQIITNRENCSKDNFRKNYSSKYLSVRWSKANSKWRANIQISGKSIHLGYFKKEIDAAKAYQDKLKNLKND